MGTRRTVRVLGSAAMALLLAGCFKVNMDLEVAADDTVSGSAVIAVDESLLELTGQSVDDLFADMDLSELPDGSIPEPYREDGFVGQQITFESVPLSEFAGSGALSGSATGEDLSIVREGDEFHVSGGLDMSGQEFTGTEVPQEFLENFEFRISITFPGEVVSATGDVDGNTVTWEPTVGQNTRIEAVASAIPSKSSPILLIVLGVLLVLVLGAVVYFLTHRTPAPAAGPATGWETTTSAGTTPTTDEGSTAAAPPVESPSPIPRSTEAEDTAPPPPPPPPSAP